METALAQASNPRTSPRRLRALASHDEAAVRSAVAANASTPLASLLALLDEFPGAVLQNAAMMLHRLEDPELFGHADVELQQAWARNAALPPDLLAQLVSSTDDEVRSGLAQNPNTPGDVLERLAFPDEFGDDDIEPRHEVMYNPSLPPRLVLDVALAFLDWWEADYEDQPPTSIFEAVLREEEAPENEFWFDPHEEIQHEHLWSVELSRGEDNEVTDDEGWGSLLYRVENGVYVQVFDSDGLCVGALSPDDEDYEQPEHGLHASYKATIWGASAAELASHRATPWRLVQPLLRHPDPEVRRDAAAHPNIEPYWLERLSRSHDPKERLAAAEHRSTAPHVLAALAADETPMIRLAVARHGSTPAETLAALANEDSAAIRHSVARHPATPTPALQTLTRDYRSSVRETASEHLRRRAAPAPSSQDLDSAA